MNDPYNRPEGAQGDFDCCAADVHMLPDEPDFEFVATLGAAHALIALASAHAHGTEWDPSDNEPLLAHAPATPPLTGHLREVYWESFIDTAAAAFFRGAVGVTLILGSGTEITLEVE